MKNKDKYKNELYELLVSNVGVNKKTNKPFICPGCGPDNCDACAFEKNTSCREQFEEWLEQQAFIDNDTERVILENVNSRYNWIARDGDGELYIHKNKPVKLKAFGEWDGSAFSSFGAYNHLFKYINWADEEPYNIQELLACYKGG